MARTSARVVMNREAIGEVYLGLADGMLALAQRIVDEADVPDAEPFGVGLVTTGAAGAWVNGKKIGGQAAKPRGVRLERNGVTALAGFSFPGRFQETGTVNHPAQPFVTPSAARVIPHAEVDLSPAMQKRIGNRP